jgi:hypothetical protein
LVSKTCWGTIIGTQKKINLTTTYGVPPLSQNVIIGRNTIVSQIFGMARIVVEKMRFNTSLQQTLTNLKVFWAHD